MRLPNFTASSWCSLASVLLTYIVSARVVVWGQGALSASYISSTNSALCSPNLGASVYRWYLQGIIPIVHLKRLKLFLKDFKLFNNHWSICLHFLCNKAKLDHVAFFINLPILHTSLLHYSLLFLGHRRMQPDSLRWYNRNDTAPDRVLIPSYNLTRCASIVHISLGIPVFQTPSRGDH